MSRAPNRVKEKERRQHGDEIYYQKKEEIISNTRRQDFRRMVLVVIISLLMSTLPCGECEEICETKLCIKTAARVMDSMNNTINPCYDFFEFACRGWITKNPIPRSGTSWEPMAIIRDNVMLNLRRILETPDRRRDGRPIKLARALYRTCMDRGNGKRIVEYWCKIESAIIENLGVKPLHDALKKVGLPLTPPTDEEADNLDISKIAGLAHRYYRVNIFSKTDIRRDVTDGTRNRLMLEQTAPFMKGFDVYLRDPERFKTIVDAQRRYIKTMMRLAGAESKTKEYTSEIMDFATKVANTMATSEKRSSSSYRDYYLTINKLQEATDRYAKHWNWTTYLKHVFEESDIILDPNNDVAVVIDMDYFKDLATLLQGTSRRILALSVYNAVYMSIAPGTTQQYRNLEFELKKNAFGHRSELADWFKCTKIANLYFDEAITAVYVEKYFNVQERQKAIEMWGDITQSFDNMLNELQWMDDRTKAQAHKKLHAMRFFVGFPEWITNPRKLDEYYRGIQVFEGRLMDTYSLFNLVKGREKLNSWRQIPDKNKWVASATTINAFYSPTMNTATIPAGMLHAPLYSNGVEALNYGAIGAIMGHELTHGFDNRGRRFNDKGNMQQWWSKKSLKRYQERVNCIINQYSEYEVTQLGNNFKLDGVKTQGENIADNGGLEEAFRGYKKLKERKPQKSLPGLEKYTDEQLFFLGFAQMWCGSERNAALERWISNEVHPPNRYRVIGTLQNSPEFAEAYNCPRGSRMNPDKKCSVW